MKIHIFETLLKLFSINILDVTVFNMLFLFPDQKDFTADLILC
jgi:hypothetical protein